MTTAKIALVGCFSLVLMTGSGAQILVVNPQVRSKIADGKVTVVDVVPHFVSGIRLPEPVNSIAVGDPALFQVEHSEREPDLVLVKAITEKSAETNLIVSTIHGRQFSLLLLNCGSAATVPRVDFLLQYKPAASFLVEPEIVPFPLIGPTTSINKPEPPLNAKAGSGGGEPLTTSLDDLLERQKNAPLPTLYGERIEGENVKGNRLRVGVSEVLDGGDQVTVLFSVLNTTKHAILLMPPQVQLGGKNKTGKVVKHDRWSTAEQLPVADFRLSRRRVGTRERADGVVVFERPPYKRANEQLFLQMAESGAVDRPALAPIGFGVSSVRQEEEHGTRTR
jgi:hypothetical protein